MISRRTLLASLASRCWPSAAADYRHPSAHQYSGRSDAELIAHQRDMGITVTVLLPAGSSTVWPPARAAATPWWRSHGSIRRVPLFANELRIFPRRVRIERYLKMGALGIGEQKFPLEADSPHVDLVAAIARVHGVPVLMHFEHGNYNRGIDKFARVLARHPRVNFIGHAQTWWGNIDRKHQQTEMYPKTPVTPGGITDRLLSDYPNMYGDMSAGSGLNSMLRDEEQARGFLKRHQDKLLFGSDCSDRNARGGDCLGTKILAAIGRLAPDKAAERQILFGNASKLWKITVSSHLF
jgi:hypothetical protein